MRRSEVFRNSIKLRIKFLASEETLGEEMAVLSGIEEPIEAIRTKDGTPVVKVATTLTERMSQKTGPARLEPVGAKPNPL